MKDDTISRKVAIDAVKDRYYKYGRNAKVEELVWTIEDLPSAQPERKTGQWLLHTYMPHNKYCSYCENDSPYNKRWDYCPYCGSYNGGKN